ncbi:hypothetical protein PR048_032039 [Dryococelus australis]|uniref:Uncharacterized protein n=1 Tax=Dryococelus australis TaxID=614101 RepID=A0ABQ9G6Z6_9NEOP|nr:hypothetical protein PR048_032039 [Dryococelus australis]
MAAPRLQLRLSNPLSQSQPNPTIDRYYTKDRQAWLPYIFTHRNKLETSGLVLRGQLTIPSSSVDHLWQGASVDERVACLPPTKAIRVRSPARSLQTLACSNRAGRCRWSASFVGDLPFPPSVHSGLNHPQRLLRPRCLKSLHTLICGSSGPHAAVVHCVMKATKPSVTTKRHDAERAIGSCLQVPILEMCLHLISLEVIPQHHSRSSPEKQSKFWHSTQHMNHTDHIDQHGHIIHSDHILRTERSNSIEAAIRKDHISHTVQTTHTDRNEQSIHTDRTSHNKHAGHTKTDLPANRT